MITGEQGARKPASPVREETDGKGPEPRAPRRRSTSLEVAGTGNGADLIKDTGVAQPAGKPAAMKAPGPTISEPPRQSPTLQRF
jgi:hypothetical protein